MGVIVLQIDFHNIQQEQKGEYSQGELPFVIDVKGERKTVKIEA
jgi:hypothetical protein